MIGIRCPAFSHTNAILRDICQVLAIPGQEIINGVNGRDRNVGGVMSNLRRKHAGSHDGLRQSFSFRP
jgi:hypothetical protein